MEGDYRRFINYMNAKWLVPPEMSLDAPEITKYHLYRKEDWKAVIEFADECCIFGKGVEQREKNAHRLTKILEDHLGYSIINRRYQKKGQNYTYKLLIGWDELVLDRKERGEV